MTGSAAIGHRLTMLRAAIDEAGALRAPGGDVLQRALDLAQDGEATAALQTIEPLAGGGALSGVVRLLAALLLDAAGRRDEARPRLACAVDDDNTGYEVLCLAADALLDWDMPEEAARACDRAIALAPHASHAILRRGRALSAAGDVTGALADLRRATLLQPNLVEAHLALGDELRDASMTEGAIEAYRRALSVDPGNAAAEAALDAQLASMIPPWHTAMLNDARRNDAFDAAIRRAVGRYAAEHRGTADDMEVLDIGTGTGLLAMMAVRAGAGHVTACESIGPLAEVAREIVARNGMADRITVIHKRSAELAVGDDLPRRADLLTAEIVDAGLLSEAILPTIADARARLLQPGAGIIPGGAAVLAFPVESAAIGAERRVDRAAGFDITPFNALTPKLYLQTDLSHYDWRPLSAPVELFGFDFTGPLPTEDEMSVRAVPITDGTAHAIAFWFRLALDSDTVLASGPMDPPTHWKQAVYAVDPPVEVKQNEPVRLGARHDGRKIVLWLDG